MNISPQAESAAPVQNGDRTTGLSTGTSLFLDVLRFGAAITVAAGHLTQAPFSSGLKDRTSLATFAVVLFFLLSGFVIRFVTTRKSAPQAHYWIDRISRLYSVMAPALLFTLAADTLSRHYDRNYYDLFWGNDYNHFLFRIVTNLTFVSELWRLNIYPFSNSPFWSLGFESIYYALYGIAFYFKGWRRVVLLLVVAIAAGHVILALFPIWLGGCLLYELYRRWRGSRKVLYRFGGGFLLTAVLAVAARYPLMAAQRWINREFPGSSFWDRVSIRWYEAAIPAFFLILFAVLLTDYVTIRKDSVVASLIRNVAEGTFPLYLFHFPTYILLNATLHYDKSNRYALAAILLGVVLLSVLLGLLFNRLKIQMRRWIFGVIEPSGSSSSATEASLQAR